MPDVKQAKPGRPRTMASPQTIRLSLDRPAKKALQKLAFDAGVSASQLVSLWINREASR